MLALLLLFLSVIGIILVIWKFMTRKECPSCQSYKITRINQSAKNLRQYDLISGENAGKMLMMEVEETFHCSDCGHTWKETHTEA